ncbi:hypothetical protein EYF80_040792 [Liparis tanakae]|uniref:Uncharacterized protein n=1 Tax=Liparis tanakae TaxID=230148 RepID=A0A4Z2G7C4_9TELE|nr:hypothetical protein EYF80_040792 [Liparis tanakae]
MAWMERGTGEGLSVAAPLGWREWPMGLMVVRGRWGAREKVSWCFGCRGSKCDACSLSFNRREERQSQEAGLSSTRRRGLAAPGGGAKQHQEAGLSSTRRRGLAAPGGGAKQHQEAGLSSTRRRGLAAPGGGAKQHQEAAEEMRHDFENMHRLAGHAPLGHGGDAVGGQRVLLAVAGVRRLHHGVGVGVGAVLLLLLLLLLAASVGGVTTAGAAGLEEEEEEEEEEEGVSSLF